MQATVRVVCGATCLLLLVSPRVQAQSAEEPVDLVWNAPADCPSGEVVLAEVARVLRGSRGPRLPVAVSVDVTSAPAEAARWSAVMRVDTSDTQSERRFDAGTCQAIASAASLIIAVAVEGGMPSSSSPSPESGPTLAKSQTDGAERSRSTTVDSQLIVAAAGMVDDGTMPRPPAGGVEATVGWSGHASGWRLRALAGTSYFPSKSAPSMRTGEGGIFSLVASSARVCASLVWGALDIGPCVGGEVDIMNASGAGPTTTFDSGTANSIWGSALGAVVATWSLPDPFALFARAEGLVPFAQQRFVLMPGGLLVHQPAQAGLRVAIGIELRFF